MSIIRAHRVIREGKEVGQCRDFVRNDLKYLVGGPHLSLNPHPVFRPVPVPAFVYLYSTTPSLPRLPSSPLSVEGGGGGGGGGC